MNSISDFPMRNHRHCWPIYVYNTAIHSHTAHLHQTITDADSQFSISMKIAQNYKKIKIDKKFSD